MLKCRIFFFIYSQISFSKNLLILMCWLFVRYLIIIILNNGNCKPRSCIINIAPTDSYNAIPSKFNAAPIGTRNFVTSEFIPKLSKLLIVCGTVAVLKFNYFVRVNKVLSSLDFVFKFLSHITSTMFLWRLQRTGRVWI